MAPKLESQIKPQFQGKQIFPKETASGRQWAFKTFPKRKRAYVIGEDINGGNKMASLDAEMSPTGETWKGR
ncbi:hypothetical protein SLA2020_257710 [Shorea laevis]